MNKKIVPFQSMAIKKAASGKHHLRYDDAERARTVYGFSNFALQKSPEELKEAWIVASKSLRKQQVK